LNSKKLLNKLQVVLIKYGYAKNTLFAASLCCDEVNRVLEKELAKAYWDNFSVVGLAGFPFCGVTSFGAMAHHIPKDRSCLIVYQPQL